MLLAMLYGAEIMVGQYINWLNIRDDSKITGPVFEAQVEDAIERVEEIIFDACKN